MILALLLATLFNTVSSTSTPCSGTSYSVPFPYGATSGAPDLVVAAGGVTIPYSSGWTINKVSSTSTGTITLTTTCTGTLSITRTTPRTQTVNFATQGKLDTAVLTATLDRIEMQMQESVVQGGTAIVGALSLTTPLGLSSGGSGNGFLGPCGAGFLTVVGTQMVCQVPSGLAPPGTTSIALQSTSPGAPQTGHINVSGAVIAHDFIPVAGGALGCTAVNGASCAFSTALPIKSVAANPSFAFDDVSGGLGVGSGFIDFLNGGSRFMSLGYRQLSLTGGMNANAAQCGSGGCITSSTTLNILSQATNGLVNIDTVPFAVASGPLFQVKNNGTVKSAVDFAGVGSFTGVTSSGPMSGTTGAFTSGVTIGASGTTISGSFRGTTTWNPGTLAACGAGPCATATTNVTVTGAATGSDCIASVLSPAPLSGYPVQCIITATNTCGLMIVNQSNVGITFGSATFACRVFNP